MGLCRSQEVKRSSEIEDELLKQKEVDDKTIKLLLLGPGECGKSTILKQMQIIHNDGFTKADVLPYKPVIFNNIINAIYDLTKATNTYGTEIKDVDLRNFSIWLVTQIESLEISIPFKPEVEKGIKRLWECREIQEIYHRRHEFQLEDSAKYFLEELDRIQRPDYIPTQQDVLHARASTNGVVEVNFMQGNTRFRVFDVGGQKSERRKWIHYFDDVTAIIFMVAACEYDRFLREDNTTNRMVDSLQLFDAICNNCYFLNTDFTLFLNKIDLFKEKIKHASIRLAFSDYQGASTYEACITFLKMQFMRLNKGEKTIVVHETCATDTSQVQVVIKNVIETIIEKNLTSLTKM